ncbi:heterokaryon incompatibility protein-domain-containing protein, partial [Alternaria rosae]|uniref:heterokaryon incompatibility protein-domain-containing protein n=1 Tax=Alternaria rosae TaxID=1187941 RepID=UPI001E8CE875
MPPSGDPYVDVPLNLGRKNIRLVTIEPSHASGPMKCILQSHALDECPAYVALSYAWGTKQQYDKIRINGSSFPVGRNLWHFLHQMRTQHQHVSFWIDAISIDQANVFEQNHQVQMMREIYTQAYSVFWTARKAKAVLELCERGYWRRIWIVQEVLLAKHVQILCGGYCVGWTKLQQLLEDFQAISDRGRSLHVVGVPAVLESSAAIIIRAKAQWNGVPQPFTSLLEQYRRQHSTDVRDKVYALHGLASDSGMIPINYRIDPKQLLTQMICHVCSPLAPTIVMEIARSSTGLLGFAKLMQESLKVFCDREELGRLIAVAE